MRGDHPLRIRYARRLGEGRRVDHVTAIAWQCHPIAGFGIGRAWLGVLACEAAHADHRRAHAVNQHQAHLQQHLEPVGDRARLTVGEVLRTVTALQQEALALLRVGQLLLQREYLPRSHQRRQLPQLAQRCVQRLRIGVCRHLQRWLATPAIRRPVAGDGGG